jgi:hypothetical protein
VLYIVVCDAYLVYTLMKMQGHKMAVTPVAAAKDLINPVYGSTKNRLMFFTVIGFVPFPKWLVDAANSTIAKPRWAKYVQVGAVNVGDIYGAAGLYVIPHNVSSETLKQIYPLIADIQTWFPNSFIAVPKKWTTVAATPKTIWYDGDAISPFTAPMAEHNVLNVPQSLNLISMAGSLAMRTEATQDLLQRYYATLYAEARMGGGYQRRLQILAAPTAAPLAGTGNIYIQVNQSVTPPIVFTGVDTGNLKFGNSPNDIHYRLNIVDWSGLAEPLQAAVDEKGLIDAINAVTEFEESLEHTSHMINVVKLTGEDMAPDAPHTLLFAHFYERAHLMNDWYFVTGELDVTLVQHLVTNHISYIEKFPQLRTNE